MGAFSYGATLAKSHVQVEFHAPVSLQSASTPPPLRDRRPLLLARTACRGGQGAADRDASEAATTGQRAWPARLSSLPPRQQPTLSLLERRDGPAAQPHAVVGVDWQAAAASTVVARQPEGVRFPCALCALRGVALAGMPIELSLPEQPLAFATHYALSTTNPKSTMSGASRVSCAQSRVGHRCPQRRRSPGHDRPADVRRTSHDRAASGLPRASITRLG